MTTEEQDEQPRTIAKPTSQGGDEIKIVSKLHYPLNGTIWTEIKGRRSEGTHWNINPGDNLIPRAVWEKIKDLQAIKSRLDHDELVPGQVSTISVAEHLLAPAPRSLIRRLSARAKRIEDNEVFGVNGQSDARLRQLEAQIRKLQGS